MAKQAQTTYREIIADIRKRQIAPVYILMGEEEYFIDNIVSMLEETVVDPGERDFNCFSFYGAEADIETVANTARQFPLMSDRRLVVLKEAQAMDRAKSQLDKLAPYLEHPVATTVLVIAYKGDRLAATSAIMKAAARSDAVVFRSERVKEYNIASIVRDYCTSIGVRIDDKAIAMLTELQGTELKRIFSEIDKIIVAEKGNAVVISPNLVDRHTGFNKDFNNFELTAALAVKDYPKAMKIVDYFSRSPRQHPAMMSVALIFSFFARLVVAECLKDRSDAAIMSALNAKSEYAIREVKNAMRYYSLRQAAACISAIRDFDTQSKGIGSTRNEFDLLRELVFKIVSL